MLVRVNVRQNIFIFLTPIFLILKRDDLARPCPDNLWSGLIDCNQKMTVAAIEMADFAV